LLYSLLTSALWNVTGELHFPATLPAGQNPGTRQIGGRLGLRAGVDACGEKSLASAGIRTPDPPSRSLDTIPTTLSQLLSFLWGEGRLLLNDGSIEGYMESNNDTVIGK
jgi:hypothetical protein